VSQLLERALRLWTDPLPEGDAAIAAFRTVYSDPLDVNGESTALGVVVDRARMLQGAFEGLRHHIKERFEAPGRQAFAFQLIGRHVGPLETPLGVIAATGRELTLNGMDIFVVDDEAQLVTGVWAVTDLLDVVVQAGVEVSTTPGATP
jgi:hypothetical protein